MPSSSMYDNPIATLCNILSGECIRTIPAQNVETANRWRTSTLAQLREGYHIQEMKAEHTFLVESALAKWKQDEAVIVGLFGKSRETFLDWFSQLRESMWANNSTPIFLLPSGETSLGYGATELSRLKVRNITQCLVFSAFLPLALPQFRRSLAQTGMMMSSIFYLERIAKERDKYNRQETVDLDVSSVPLDVARYERINAYWLRAQELQTQL